MTDNGSAKIKSPHGVIQGYTGIAAADAKAQVTVCVEAHGTDWEGGVFPDVLDNLQNTVKEITGKEAPLKDAAVPAGTNYSSEMNLKAAEERGIEVLIPDTRFRVRDGRFAGRRAPKKGNRFVLEDFKKVNGQRLLFCLVHNIRKCAPYYAQKKGLPDAKLTCRHFGIHRSYFCRRKKRYEPKRLSSLENKPPVPKRKREPCYSREPARAVRAVREADPSYSAKKIRPILLRSTDAAEVPSAAAPGRLIARENLLFRPDTKRHKKHSKAAKTAHERMRKLYDLKAHGARRIIGFDMKHVYVPGHKHYAFCAVGPCSKEAAAHTASSPASRNAKAALEKAAARFGKTITAVNDSGSENMKDAQAYLASQGITQYWTRPKSPKEKPFVERLTGTFQRECLDCHYEPVNAGELREIVDSWLDKYHFYRPHESLGFLTPAEFSAALGLSIPRAGVS